MTKINGVEFNDLSKEEQEKFVKEELQTVNKGKKKDEKVALQRVPGSTLTMKRAKRKPSQQPKTHHPKYEYENLADKSKYKKRGRKPKEK